ncbi:MAG: AMP-binding protein, partial [Oscillospiraceae bacterium]|nr:AMP-binding protein [Oscillospiraceae bacterium]
MSAPSYRAERDGIDLIAISAAPLLSVAGSREQSPRRAAENALSDAICRAERENVPCVLIDASPQSALDILKVTHLLDRTMSEAVCRGVTLLLPTRGAWADTGALTETLDIYASDNLASYWDAAETALRGESADLTISRLGAYVRGVSVAPPAILRDVQNALGSIDYKGAVKSKETITKVTRNQGNADNSSIWDKTFSQLLDEICEKFPTQLAFDYSRDLAVTSVYPEPGGMTPALDGYTRTYREFRADADEFARALIALGVTPGTKVAVWLTNVPQWYIAFWAAVKIGAVLVTVNTAYKIREAEYLLRQADVHTLIMIDGYKDSDYAGIIAELCPELQHTPAHEPLRSTRLPFLRHIINITSPQKGCMSWDDARILASRVPQSEVERLAALVTPDDVCNMQYTSGTTGFPKGVMLTHRNIVNNGKCIGDRMKLSEADRMMIQVPMFHCFGMVLAMTASMTHAVTMSPVPYYSPRAGLACIKDRKITCFHGVPTMFIAMLEHPDFNPGDFAYMRTGIMAGSPCPVPVMKDVVSKMNMSQITIVFGQTESSPGCTQTSTDDAEELRVATVGYAFPGVECKIVDPETGADLPPETDGEFVARGYNIMKGYYKMPGATSSAIDADGWLHFGDIARAIIVDGVPYYKITGRLKDMI